MDQRRINVRALVYKNGKILAVKHKSQDGSEGAYWSTPGGGLDDNEALEAGVARELLEETGVVAKVGRLLYVQQFPSERLHRREELEFVFLIDNPEDFAAIDLSATEHGDIELARCEFVDPHAVTILPRFLSELDLETYVTTVQPVYFHSEL